MVDMQSIRNNPNDFLHVEEVGAVLGIKAQGIRDQAHKDPKMLGFPVTVIGCRVLIPKQGFIAWYEGR